MELIRPIVEETLQDNENHTHLNVEGEEKVDDEVKEAEEEVEEWQEVEEKGGDRGEEKAKEGGSDLGQE